MIAYPHFNPDIVSLGPLHIRWYGMMYILGFLFGYLLLKKRNEETGLRLDKNVLMDFAFYLFVGVLLGGRVGYVLFYNPLVFLANPLEILAVHHGGMSFHGGLIGTILAGYVFCWQQGIHYYKMADAVIPAIPIGLGLGRLGNFINAELWGRPTDVQWAMVFPTDPAQLPRHPSQLYEFALEGVALFVVLMLLRRLQLAPGVLFWTFFTLYGLARITCEFFREPDAHLSFLFANVTAGMVLSVPMVVGGVVMVTWLTLRARTQTPAASAA
ncbi:MAG: prolipoprotein diacylglyceryl transferase [Candidatus Sericytochromatia bacterium]|nr:prolipoprotein diacylglyceryl transferase [Candidatus Sericytochromatia bacterium]